MITKHNNRGLLALSGTDASDFLQSVITQDVTNLHEGVLSYGAHLTPQGKYLFDFFIGKQGGKFVLECPKENLMPLAKALHKYLVSKNVVFEDITEDYSVLTSFEPFNSAVEDPRHPSMGYRAWVKNEGVEKSINTDTSAYTQKRIELVIPENDGIENKTLVNELNFERINGVSFNKGCYVGQELTARTKFRTEPKKRLFLAQLDTENMLEKGLPILSGKTEAGWLLSNQNGKGIALLRLRYAEKEDLTVNGQKLTILKRDDA